jgi:hypothetical protein
MLKSLEVSSNFNTFKKELKALVDVKRPPDMIEIGSWIGLAAMTKVKLLLKCKLG